MREYLDLAVHGDIQVEQKFNSIKDTLAVLMGGYASLHKFIPNSNYVKLDKNVANVVAELRTALNDWDSIESSRSQFLQDVEIKNRDNNILPKLIQEYKQRKEDALYDNQGQFHTNAFELVYESHLKMLDLDISYIQQTKLEQQQLESRIDTINTQFIQLYTSTVNSTQQKRQMAMQQLDSAYVMYTEIKVNLNEGLKFYHDFITRGNNVLRDAEEYLRNRRMESRELEMEMKLKMTKKRQQVGNNNLQIPVRGQSDTATSREQPKLVSPRGQKSNVWDPNSGIKFG